MKRLLILAAFVGMFGGCAQGVAPLWSKKDAQKRLTAHYNPWTGMVEWDFFSNDGTELSADELYGKAGDKEFRATNVHITNKAVELTDADARVLEVATRLTQVAIDSIFSGVQKNNPFAGAKVSVDSPIGKGILETGGGATTAPATP